MHHGATGLGECVPYARYGETLESVTAEIERLPEDISRQDLQDALGPGAATQRGRLRAMGLEGETRRRAGAISWPACRRRARWSRPSPCRSTHPRTCARPRPATPHRPLLKIKLGTPDDMPRLEAVREGAPDASLIVDANEGWTAEVYSDLAPHLLRLGVKLVEQPLPAGEDDLLAEIDRPLPVCADESCHDRATLAALEGKYDMVNIKLDKTGGLTEALALKTEAEAIGFGVMVGCMVGSSLAMAPALLVAQGAEIVDLDGPLLLARDRDVPLRFEGSTLHPADPALWG